MKIHLFAIMVAYLGIVSQVWCVRVAPERWYHFWKPTLEANSAQNQYAKTISDAIERNGDKIKDELRHLWHILERGICPDKLNTPMTITTITTQDTQNSSEVTTSLQDLPGNKLSPADFLNPFDLQASKIESHLKDTSTYKLMDFRNSKVLPASAEHGDNSSTGISFLDKSLYKNLDYE